MLSRNNFQKIFQKPKIAASYAWMYLWYRFGLTIPASQFWEDLILSYLIRKNDGFYVDIWANDPFGWNNTYLFYRKGRTGITIEPNKQLFKKLKKYRSRGINLNMAVGLSWSLTYYEIDTNGMSTCDKEIADFYESKGHVITNTYETPVKKLSEIFDTHVKWNKIDLLSVDAEWMDLEILKSNNRDKYKPSYIILETMSYVWDNEIGVKDDKEFTQYLKDYWYKVIADTYINTIYQLQ